MPPGVIGSVAFPGRARRSPEHAITVAVGCTVQSARTPSWRSSQNCPYTYSCESAAEASSYWAFSVVVALRTSASRRL
jgi:hypothetical protein